MREGEGEAPDPARGPRAAGLGFATSTGAADPAPLAPGDGPSAGAASAGLAPAPEPDPASDPRQPRAPRGSLARSFRAAFAGLALAAGERNFRIELALLLVAVALGVALGIERHEWLAIICLAGTVLGLEAANSAFERTLDRISLAHDERIGAAKDLAAGAVLVSALAALAAGICIFAPRILHILSTL